VAWPWTINANNNSYMFATKQEAIRKVQKLQRLGIRSIDVGCMQVNLKHHPQAFKNLEQAFEPSTNVAYAAKLLNEKKLILGSWYQAIAHYHSSTAKYNMPYKARVLKIWSQVQRSNIIADEIMENIPFELRKSALELMVTEIKNHTGEFTKTIATSNGHQLPLTIAFRPYQGFNQKRTQLFYYGKAKHPADEQTNTTNLTHKPKFRLKKSIPSFSTSALIQTSGTVVAARKIKGIHLAGKSILRKKKRLFIRPVPQVNLKPPAKSR
jgi:hypothetical protein